MFPFRCRMGEMEGWMDENFIKNIFQTVLAEGVQVKVIRDRNSGYVSSISLQTPPLLPMTLFYPGFSAFLSCPGSSITKWFTPFQPDTRGAGFEEYVLTPLQQRRLLLCRVCDSRSCSESPRLKRHPGPQLLPGFQT